MSTSKTQSPAPQRSRILLSAEEAGRELGTLPARVKRWAKAGALPHVVLPDGEIRFRRVDLESFADSRLVEGGPGE